MTQKSLSVIATSIDIDGIQLWPVSYGAIIWLRDVRKNALILGDIDKASEFDIAELCFSFANHPLELTKLSKADCDKGIKDLLYGNSSETLSSVLAYAVDQLQAHVASVTVPKKKQAAKVSTAKKRGAKRLVSKRS